VAHALNSNPHDRNNSLVNFITKPSLRSKF